MARLWHEGRPGSYAVLPIVTDQQAPGALVCASRDARRYSAPELAFLHGVADVLAGALDRTSNQQPSPTHLHAASALVWQALALRREEHGASACPEGACAQRTLAHLFQHLNGAASVSTQGFATDIANSDARLGAVIARARAGEEAPRDEWTVDGAPHSAAAVSVPLDDGARAAVGALWTERRLDPEADHALLVAFAGAYLLALRST